MSDNFKGVLKQANNDVTGDAIRTGKGGNEKFAAGWDAIFGKKGIPPEPGPMELPPLTDCMAEESTGYCHDNRCPKIAHYDDGGCPHRVKLYGGCLGGGKSWQGNQNLSTVFPPPLEIDWIILDEVTDLSNWTEVDDIAYDRVG